MKLDIVDRLPNTLRNSAIAQNVVEGQRLFRKGDRANYLYLIQQGRFQEVSYPDKMAVLQILNTGETLGETSLFFDTYHTSAIAKTEAQVIAYPKSIVLESLKQSPLVIEATLEILSQKISQLQMRLEWRDISLADRRVLKYLKYNLAKLSEDAEDAKTTTLKAPLQEIAAELGLIPGTLSIALAKLEAEQMITSDNNRITLPNTVTQPKLRQCQYYGGLPKYKLKQAIDYIDTHLSENIKVFDLANIVNISQYYFCHLFKQSTGISPYQYIIQQRIAKAKKLLKQRKLSLVEVALECGFTSQSQMTQHFRRCVGLTPNVYRNLE